MSGLTDDERALGYYDGRGRGRIFREYDVDRIVQQRVDAAKAEALAPIEALASKMTECDEWRQQHAGISREWGRQLRAAIRDGRGGTA